MKDYAREVCPQCFHVHCVASFRQHELMIVPNHQCDFILGTTFSANTGIKKEPHDVKRCGCNFWKENK